MCLLTPTTFDTLLLAINVTKSGKHIFQVQVMSVWERYSSSIFTSIRYMVIHDIMLVPKIHLHYPQSENGKMRHRTQ